MHFPSCSRIFVTPGCGQQRPLLSEFTLSLLALTGGRFHKTHCSAPRMLLKTLLALGPPAHLPGLCSCSSLYLAACHFHHRATASPQLWSLSLFCYLWISCQQLIPGKFHFVTLSLFQWLLRNSDQPSIFGMWPLSASFYHEDSPVLRQFGYSGSHSFPELVFTEQ